MQANWAEIFDYLKSTFGSLLDDEQLRRVALAMQEYLTTLENKADKDAAVFAKALEAIAREQFPRDDIDFQPTWNRMRTTARDALKQQGRK